MKIHIGDNVLVISGKERGKTGTVQRVFGKKNQVVVEKINMRTKHIKKKQGQAGQKIRYEAPISVSNVMIICPSCSKATRIKHIILKNGVKQRGCVKCNQSVDKPVERKKTKKR